MTTWAYTHERFFTPRHRHLWLTVAAIALLLTLLGGMLLSLNRPATAATLPPPAQLGQANELLTAQSQIAAQQTITARDIVVVFDVSGSTEFETTCFDCWVRTDSSNPDWPNNGYFNPLPYNTAWKGSDTAAGSSIPASDLCVAAPTSHVSGDGDHYLVHEAELYSREVGDWRYSARTQGQGFWVLQRGSQNVNNANNPFENGAYKGNQAGNEALQSSNVCNPGLFGSGINCSPRRDGVTPDNVCADDPGIPNDGSDIIADCSAYIKAHPYVVYTQGNRGKLQGAAYDITCFSTGTCWNNVAISDPTRPLPNFIPYVEYDFTPDWSGTVNIWIRARGGSSSYARAWNGLNPPSTTSYNDVVMWQVDGGTVSENNLVSKAGTFYDNRIVPFNWQWIKLGSVSGVSGVQQVLRIYQGSAGYKIDKIIFTDATDGSAKPYIEGYPDKDGNTGKGPPATNGSATREACNLCNPEFGLTVASTQCTCKTGPGDGANGGYGSGQGCTLVSGFNTTNQLRDDLYRGPEPLRSAQESVKHFARQLDPQVDQVGLVAFSTDVKTGSGAYERRARLQCLQDAAVNGGVCVGGSNSISFTRVLEAVERQWSDGGTDIAEGLREGLRELGVAPYATNSDCTPGLNNGSACDRGGAAHKIMILLTDGEPNQDPGNCAPGEGRPDLWNGDFGSNDDAFECAVYFAKEAADAGVIVYTIGIGPGPEPDLLTAIAEGHDPHSYSGIGDEFLFDTCGGQFFNAAKPTDLDAILDQISPENLSGCPQSVTQVVVGGPTTGLTGMAHTFTATSDPLIASQPISYVWQAADQTIVTHPDGGLTDTISFKWTTPGPKVITVTAESDTGQASDSHTITLEATPYCQNLLLENGFETAPSLAWQWPPAENINLNPSSIEAHSGLYSLDASTFDTSYNEPVFYQQITLPDWVMSTTTTIKLDLYQFADALGTPDLDDEFFVALTTSPDPASRITEPVLVARGVNTNGWEQVVQTLPLSAGVNLQDYVAQDLYLYFYNNSNAPGCFPPTGVNCHTSRYLFDDIYLSACRTTPFPATGLTLSGPTTGGTLADHSFTATVSPDSATSPFTYLWQATDQAPVNHPGEGGSDTVTFSWTTPGPKTITVSADNGAGSVNDSHTIVISSSGSPETVIYLPLILKS